MLWYRNKIKTSVMMTKGRVDPAELSSQVAVYTEFDQRIIRLAEDKLGTSLKTTFFYAYACKEWEEIQELFFEQFEKELDLETLKRYVDRTILAIVSASKNAKEFN